eukprot:gnl/MRDRNA2_/MRDRNA2_55836_c0_seq2.p1 gnl/MRDRNA2_/MRDRNA2_55836_c0~~gnl/MRDRNA2_/MRDRNA2_55836_c0_seq2.p1  ORF type:complete len:240 (+),score=40.15 gnl/MRDRNA2_/MRDRNA2_55836_c0_seq2:114-833(+)
MRGRWIMVAKDFANRTRVLDEDENDPNFHFQKGFVWRKDVKQQDDIAHTMHENKNNGAPAPNSDSTRTTVHESIYNDTDKVLEVWWQHRKGLHDDWYLNPLTLLSPGDTAQQELPTYLQHEVCTRINSAKVCKEVTMQDRVGQERVYTVNEIIYQKIGSFHNLPPQYRFLALELQEDYAEYFVAGVFIVMVSVWISSHILCVFWKSPCVHEPLLHGPQHCDRDCSSSVLEIVIPVIIWC